MRVIMQSPAYGLVPNDKVGVVGPDGEKITKAQVDIDMQQFADSYRAAKSSKVLLFDKDQIDIFLKLIERGDFLPSVDYALPFMDVWLQLSSPIKISAWDGSRDCIAFLLTQATVNEKQYNDNVNHISYAGEMFEAESRFMPVDWSNTQSITFNQVRTIFADMEVDVAAWTSQSNVILTLDECDPTLMMWKEKARRIAAACVQYTNCENVYLHKEGEVSDKVNRKREAKGKSRIEPYYVCRIRGVNYDSVATGTGATHSIRYDVRGHFRKLPTGKTTWVRPHQRGVHNELYVPKVYKVDGDSKPAWKG